MPLTEKASAIAETELRKLNVKLIEPFSKIITFYADNPALMPNNRGAQPNGGEEHIKSLVRIFYKARTPIHPSKPKTVPDPMVAFILEHYFNMPVESLLKASDEHQLAMAAENMVGDLLERYLAQNLEPTGWVWCAGSVVKSVDFIKPPLSGSEVWTVLQIKNRDNSENSSSSAIRNGTMIEKWFRTYSRTGNTNWSNFPDKAVSPQLSEDNFQSFVKKYLI